MSLRTNLLIMANSTPHERSDNISRLQHCILSLARKNEGIVLARDVLVEYYAFNPFRDPSSPGVGAVVFRKADIGVNRYNAASVAVCKAFNRLVQRGMATKIFSGIRVNPEKVAG